jgi:hypothetical protein
MRRRVALVRELAGQRDRRREILARERRIEIGGRGQRRGAAFALHPFGEVLYH